MPDDLGDAVKRASSKKLRDGLTAAAGRQAAATRGDGVTFTGWKGAWQPGTTYQRGNVVSHEGSSWRAVADHQGSEPPSQMWQYVAKKGTDGKRGADGIGAQGPQGIQGPPGPGSDLEIEDEGVNQGIASTLDFTGAGVTASVVAGQATINVPGGGSGVEVEDEGVVQGTATTLDFAGAGVTASMTGPNEALITIAGGAPGTEYPEDSPMQDGDLGNFVLGVRNDTDAVTTDADGDFSQFSVDSAGRIKVGNFPADYPDAAALAELGNILAAILAGIGVTVANFPAVQPVSDNGGSLTVDGTVAVSNFPATQPVSGTVSVTEPVSVDDNGGSLTVDATDLDIRDLTFTSDKVDVSGSQVNIGAFDPGLPGNVALQGTPANGLEVDVTRSALPTGAATAANQQTDALTDAELRAADVDVNVTNASIPVTLSEPISVDDNGGSLTVDGTVAVSNFPATQPVSGTVEITNDAGNPIPVSGTVAATLSEPISVDDNGGSLTVDNPVISVVGGGAEATAQRVTIANDSTGVLSVDDNGGSLTVDASNLDIRDLTFAADKVDVSGSDVDVTSMPLSAETVLQNAATATGNGTAMAVSGYATVVLEVTGTFSATVVFEGSRDGGTTYYPLYGQSDLAVVDRLSSAGLIFINVAGLTHIRARIDFYASGSVTVKAIATPQTYSPTNITALLLPGANSIGDVGVLSLPSIPAGSNNIGDVDVASAIPAGTNVIGGTTSVVGEVMDESGNTLTAKVAHLDMTTATTTDIVAAVASKKIRVLAFRVYINEATNTTISFLEGAGATRVPGSPKMVYVTVDTRGNFPFGATAPPGAFEFETTAGNALKVNQTGATDITVTVTYIEV